MADHSDQSALMSKFKRSTDTNPEESVTGTTQPSGNDKSPFVFFTLICVVVFVFVGSMISLSVKEGAQVKASKTAMQDATLALPDKLDLLTTELRLLRQAVERMEQLR
ncbi:hypothetical protein BCR39DRAFT_522591 [Naematelia encephala]|uniref:Uncharacterized protein n=1 Tax=Naematelia encephala TaxID=71784 RepID=A0A1Y2BCE5_9TREE|nr:hypothetical protein BCR39DRAFT_522591 [Naematelia encephala]